MLDLCLVSLLALLLTGCDGGGAAGDPPAGRPDRGDAAAGDGAAGDGATGDGAAGDGATGGDRGRADAGPGDDGPGGADGGPHDGGLDSGSDGGGGGCVQAQSARPAGALRFEDCQLVQGGLSRSPRAVVLATDSLRRDARTPLHEAEDFALLATAGVELVWLLVFWEGLEPFAGTYNGAYMGRICQQIGYADAAGLGVVLALYQEDFGAGAGGVGAPAWAGEGPPERAWAGFWQDAGAALTPAWERLLATCAGATGVVGLAPLLGRFPAPAAAFARYAQGLEASAEAAFGPLLVFWPPALLPAARPADHGPVIALAPAPQGLDAPPPGAAGGVALVGDPDPPQHGAAVAQATQAGLAAVVWADGFGGPYALRDALGAPGPGLAAALGGPWPTAIAGQLLGFGPQPDGAFEVRWVADGRGQGVSRLRVPGAVAPTVTLAPDGPFDWASGFDPVAGELTVFVSGAVGEVALTLRFGG